MRRSVVASERKPDRNGAPPLAAGSDPRIRRCRQGDRDALGAVLAEHLERLDRFVTRLVGPSPDVEDLVQTTLEAAIGAFPRFRGEASISTWLMRIATHVTMDHLRRRQVRRAADLRLVTTEEAGIASLPDSAADARRRLERLHRHLDAIEAKKRVAFVLHVVEGNSIEEVAALVGASRAATKARIFWARRQLLRRVRRDPLLRDLVEEREP